MHIQNSDLKLHWCLFLVSVCIICVIGCQINYALFFICYATLSKSCNSTSISWYFQQRLTRFKPLPPIMLDKKKKKKAMWCEFFELMIYLYFAPIWILIISIYVYVFFFFGSAFLWLCWLFQWVLYTIHETNKPLFSIKLSLKMGLTVLFTHLKIILLQCFSFFIF